MHKVSNFPTRRLVPTLTTGRQQAPYIANAPTIETIAAANRAKAAVEGVDSVAGAPLPIEVVA